ncbi:zinc finger CCCH domain-containing protein 3 isoform X3 [Juglans microcarpa x Juglans regia]|uniref:zinc finger CCCH domain-containing protein 3 isoform X3 n=1 Tax=Juglans microcarpa x Juglans regia TaxID=2249226 RepID=UPI001B7EAFD7|nr:zinc finger CCCH domain-containing protein 3 isoform X3 [Juglans microcarpa x Juglans regia]
MPLGKYYCDYCDKQFQDTPYARKRHLQGLQHLRAKALWFDSFKLQDANQAYTEGFRKGVCNHFVKTGFCQYGDSCKYFHPKNNLSNVNAQGLLAVMDDNQLPSIPGNQLIGGGALSGVVVQDSMGVSWGNLPPSLMPPPEEGYPPLPFVDWG